MLSSWLRAERGNFIYSDLRASAALGAPYTALFTPVTTEVAATNALATRKTLRKQGRDAMRKESAAAWMDTLTSSPAVGRSGRGYGYRRGSGMGRARAYPGNRNQARSALAIIAALALTGCAGHVRYVSIYCLTPPQYQKLKDAEPGKVGSKLDGNAQDDLKVIAGSAIELRQYDGDLLNVLGGCVEPGK